MAQLIGLQDIWELEELVESVIVDLRNTDFLYTAEGDCLPSELSVEERRLLREKHIANQDINIFQFITNPKLRSITFEEAVRMTLEDIYEKFLTPEVLKKVRQILRKDPRQCYGKIVSEDIHDSILNQYIAIRWKENLKIWAMQHEVGKELLATKGYELSADRAKWLEQLAVSAWADIECNNSLGPRLICSERDGIVFRRYYYWNYTVGNIKSLTYRQIGEKLNYRFFQNGREQCCHSFEEVMEAVATNPMDFSLQEGYEEDYSKQEIAFLNRYCFNMKDAVQENMAENIECYEVMSQQYLRYLGHTQAGEIVLLERYDEKAVIACGWDKYITRLLLTKDAVEVIDSNLNSVQLYFTQQVIGELKESLWSEMQK